MIAFRDNWTSLLALHNSVFFVNVLKNESPAKTTRSLITLPASKGLFFSSEVSAVLYESTAVALTLIKQEVNIPTTAKYAERRLRI
jgi:hypothetical protein